VAGAVEIQGLGKRFRRFRSDRPRSVKEALFRGLQGVRPADSFWALRDVSLRVEAGRILGIIGQNGAGKSTLLRMIGGVGRPDEGRMRVRGRVAGLLDLGAGFHPDLSGRENVYVNGIVAGLTRAEVRARFDAIVEFAELAAAIDNPLRTYSQGMRQRLGFAVATHTDPDVLLIDEMLAVGDRRFTRKCTERIAGFKELGCAVILVSHQLASVRELCDEVIELRGGRVSSRGPAVEVVDAYEDENGAGPAASRPRHAPDAEGPDVAASPLHSRNR
jgi:lipopolysaccharide transport system ATP-binding protein